MTRHRLLSAALLLGAAFVSLPVPAAAQSAAPAATTYNERYAELVRMTPAPGQVADITRLVLSRDVAQIVLGPGKLYLMTPVGGQTVAAVFLGEGRFQLEPPVAIERTELRRFAGESALDARFTEAVFIFSDSTMAQLRGLTFGPGEIPRDAGSKARDLLNSLKGEKEGSFDSDVMGPILNGAGEGFFLAWMERARGGPVLFQLNPAVAEAVQLFRPVNRTTWGTNWALVTQFMPRTGVRFSDGRSWVASERLRAPSYRVDMTLSEAFNSNLGITASSTVSLVATEPIGPWLLFRLHWKLHADSARWSSGESAALFKAEENQDLWIRAPRRLTAGDSLSLTVFYHGDMIDRYGNFFYVDPAAAWYPVNGYGRPDASYDLTYHAPKRYPLVSIGERRDSSVAGNVSTTRWVTRFPTAYASFNLGLFQPWHVQHPEAPPLDVFLSDDAHNLLRRQYASAGMLLPEQRNMRETVAADVSNSLKLFTTLFGEPQYDRFSVSEIPYNEGVSFPGFIHLSWGTFQNTAIDGFDQFFRAHEAAHQWWGNGVQPGSYRDAWLSEGLATFSGLWYLQVLRRRDTDYYRFLEQYRADIRDNLEAGPIGIGFRLSSQRTPRGYQVIVYEKGAWVFHMLRTMMTDLTTMRSERFNAMMREYYQTFKGKTATTDDFRQLVERHIGQPMDWFFDQWVNGAALPTYRVTWSAEPAPEVEGRFRVRLRVSQEGVPPGFRMPVLVSADLGGDRTARFRVNVSDAQAEYVSPLLPDRPRSIVFNAMQSVLATDVNQSNP